MDFASYTLPGVPSRAREARLRLVAALLGLLTVAAVVFAGLNFAQRARSVRPYDGISWHETRAGVQAQLVLLDTPGHRAGIRAGDIVLRINGHPIQRATDVTKLLFRAQVGRPLTYELQRYERHVTTTLVAIPQPDPFSLRGFLEFVGVLYLGIGVFVFVRRWNAPYAVHFFLFCLVSFVFYAFASSGKFNLFDWSIYWADVVAHLILPALFLHFALAFPVAKRGFDRHRWLFALLYLPAGVLLTLYVLAVGARLVPPSQEIVDWLERWKFIHLTALFLAAAGVFEWTYRRTRQPLLRQQMKWVRGGTWLAILPFTLLYVVPVYLYVLEFPPKGWMKLSTLSLVFIPLTFGYAIVRYRLMDVDIIFRRGAAYTLATLFIVSLYFAIAALMAELLQTTAGFGVGGAIVAIVAAALLFQPIKDWIQAHLERLFYREQYDSRRTLEEFGRELSSEVHLERILDALLDRLAHTLLVQRVALFLEDAHVPGQFRLARAHGALAIEPVVLDFFDTRQAQSRGCLFFESGTAAAGLTPEQQRQLDELALHYFIPCRVPARAGGSGRIPAFLALGKTRSGQFLTSEDVRLLSTLADYIGIALENARLYESLEQKATQIEKLKDFNENILQSTNIGLVAVNWDDRIESWNTAMTRLYGVAAEQALNERLAALFPAELVREVNARKDDARLSSLYKFYLRRPDGGRVVTHISIAPLLSKDGVSIGRLLLFEDVTKRVELENQLLQNEKLTSIGLLAAGVAHEVNTPLAIISNNAQLLARQTEAEDTRRLLVDKIIKQTFRASEIINSLLNFSRTTATAFTGVNLNKVIQETLSLMEPQLRSGGVRVTAELSDALAAVHGNVGKLQQVFLNLFLNAKDAMPDGGTLRVRTARNNARIQVEVTDSGIGIARENLHKIYDPFFTTKTTASGRGTGLGLAVSYGIIQEHAGTIQVSSRPGQGTSFLLEFPVHQPVGAVASQATGE
ncbi:MAG: ATP-binding protein [Terriglobia bacterium]